MPAFDPTKPFEIVDDPRGKRAGSATAQAAQQTKFDPSKPFEIVDDPRLSAPKQPEVSEQPLPRGEPFPSVPELLDRGIAAASVKIDAFTGAPTRAAIGAAQEGAGAIGAAQAFGRAFGETPGEDVPTAKEIAVRAGVPDKPTQLRVPFRDVQNRPLAVEVSPADIAGFGIDLLADPTNLIPGSVALKGGMKTGAKGVVFGAKQAGRGVKAVTPAALRKTLKEATDVIGKFFNPKVLPSFEESVRVAEKAGIARADLPEALEFGPTSLISRAAVGKRAGPLGEADAEKWIETLDKVRDAVGNKLREIGGGNVLSPVEAGHLIRQSYDDAANNIMNSVKTSYNKIGAANPGLVLSAKAQENLAEVLAKLEKKGLEQVRDKITPLQASQGQGILNAVNAIRSAEGDYQQTVNRMRNIGEAAWKSEFALAQEPPDVKALRELYGATRDALFETVKTSVPRGKKIAKELEKNNKTLSNFFGEASVIGKSVASDKIASEKLFQSLVLGDTRKIEALKQILSPDVIQALKAASVNSMILRLADDGEFSFRRLRNSMRGKQDVIKALFDPDELQELGEFITLGDRFGIPPTISAPGADISGSMRDVAKEVHSAAVNAALVDRLKDQARGLRPPPSMPFGGFGFGSGPVQDVPPLLRRFRSPTSDDIITKELQLIGAQEQVRKKKEERK